VADDRVLPETRGVAIFVIPFLLAAWIILYLLPERSKDLFAWPINPSMTARLMGSGYLAGAYFFWRAATIKTWHKVANGFLPVAIFAGLMGLSTLLHWERFSHGHFAFYTWVALYAITPVLVLLVWLRNRQADPRTYIEADVWVPASVRWVMMMVGLVLAMIALVFYIHPEWMIAVWPWPITPLTARACLAFFILSALTEIALALDPRWSAQRIIIQGQIFALALILLGAALSWPDFHPSTGWIYIVGILIVLLVNLVFYIRMESRKDPQQTRSPRS
jgi:hypothetical protein